MDFLISDLPSELGTLEQASATGEQPGPSTVSGQAKPLATQVPNISNATNQKQTYQRRKLRMVLLK